MLLMMFVFRVHRLLQLITLQDCVVQYGVAEYDHTLIVVQLVLSWLVTL